MDNVLECKDIIKKLNWCREEEKKIYKKKDEEECSQLIMKWYKKYCNIEKKE